MRKSSKIKDNKSYLTYTFNHKGINYIVQADNLKEARAELRLLLGVKMLIPSTKLISTELGV